MPPVRLVHATERLSFLGRPQPVNAPLFARTPEDRVAQQFYVTYVASVIAQLVALGLSVAAVTLRNNSAVLQLILVLETVVSAVEVTWYTAIGAFYALSDNRTLVAAPVALRYIDWVVTTPTMLVSLVFVFRWRASDGCVKPVDLVDDAEEWVILSSIVCLNTLMLAVGYVYEAREIPANSFASRWATRLDPVGGHYLGWLFFIGAFVAVGVALLRAYTVEGAVTFTATFVLWALYGGVAFGVSTPSRKNTLYNGLDILSKNVVAIVIAALALSGEEASRCSSA